MPARPVYSFAGETAVPELVGVHKVSTYVFDPAWTLEHDRLLAIESLFDEDSMGHLVQLGAGPGWHCLEVGCGAGGIARRLAGLVGETGRVVALDLDTRFVDDLEVENLEVRRQDLMVDPLEQSAFDLVHARAVFMHLPDRQRALERVVGTVRAGGWVVIEDPDLGGTMAAAMANYIHPAGHAALSRQMYRAVEAVFAGAGADPSYGSRLIGGLKSAGLEDVRGALYTPLVSGGTERFVPGTVEYLRSRLPGTGFVSAEEVDRFLRLTEDPSTTYAPLMKVTVWGRRPVA